MPALEPASVAEVADLSATLEPDRLHLLVPRLVDHKGRELAQNTDWFHASLPPQPHAAHAPLRALAPLKLRASVHGSRRRDEWAMHLK